MGMAFYPADGKTVTELMPWAHPMHPSAPGTRKAYSTCLSAHIRLQQGLLGLVRVHGHAGIQFRINFTHELVQTAIALKNQREEFDDAVEAMDEVLTAVESGETTVDGGKLNFQRMPAFLHGMRNIAPEQRSPIQKLVGRFINVINRVQQGIDAMRFGRRSDNDSQSPGL